MARSCPIHEYSTDRFANDAYRILKQFNKSSIGSTNFSPALIHLGLGAGKFTESLNTKSIVDLFSKQNTKPEVNHSWTQKQDDDDRDSELEQSDGDENPIVVEKPTVQGDFFQKFRQNQTTAEIPSNVESKSNSSTIKSFFSRYSSQELIEVSPSANESDDQFVTCSKCQKSILVWDVPEHDDFHFARDLQIEENQVQTATKPVKSNKRKAENSSSKNQTLDGFFTKKSKI